VHVHIAWKEEYRPVGWSFGYCKYCGENFPIKLEAAWHALYLYGLFALQDQRTQTARCDFCQRNVEFVIDVQPIEYSAWSPEEGVPALLRKLGLPASSAPSTPDLETQLRSLLASAEEAANRFHPSRLWSVLGTLVGLGVGIMWHCSCLKVK
jgi:hypothetical protein